MDTVFIRHAVAMYCLISRYINFLQSICLRLLGYYESSDKTIIALQVYESFNSASVIRARRGLVSKPLWEKARSTGADVAGVQYRLYTGTRRRKFSRKYHWLSIYINLSAKYLICYVCDSFSEIVQHGLTGEVLVLTNCPPGGRG